MAVQQIFMMQHNLGSGVLRRWQWGVGDCVSFILKPEEMDTHCALVVMAPVPTGKCFVVFFKTMSTILMEICSLQLSLNYQCAPIKAPPTGQCLFQAMSCRWLGSATPVTLHPAPRL